MKKNNLLKISQSFIFTIYKIILLFCKHVQEYDEKFVSGNLTTEFSPGRIVATRNFCRVEIFPRAIFSAQSFRIADILPLKLP